MTLDNCVSCGEPLGARDTVFCSDAAGKWGCPDIERLLLAIKERIAAVERTRAGKGEE